LFYPEKGLCVTDILVAAWAANGSGLPSAIPPLAGWATRLIESNVGVEVTSPMPAIGSHPKTYKTGF